MAERPPAPREPPRSLEDVEDMTHAQLKAWVKRPKTGGGLGWSADEVDELPAALKGRTLATYAEDGDSAGFERALSVRGVSGDALGASLVLFKAVCTRLGPRPGLPALGESAPLGVVHVFALRAGHGLWSFSTVLHWARHCRLGPHVPASA
jgi:hypothetical protein